MSAAVKKMKNSQAGSASVFFHHSALKYKNAGSCVQRDDSSFRQRLHYSEGFREECGWWETTMWKGEGNNVRGGTRRWLFDEVSESWKFHNGLWWARLKVHWRFLERKDTESGWRECEAGSKPFRSLNVLLFRTKKKRKVPSPHGGFPAPRTSLEMNEYRYHYIADWKTDAELTEWNINPHGGFASRNFDGFWM